MVLTCTWTGIHVHVVVALNPHSGTNVSICMWPYTWYLLRVFFAQVIPLSILPLQACAMADLAHLSAPFPLSITRWPATPPSIPWLTLITSPFPSLLPSWPNHALREFCLLHGGSRSPSPTWSYYLHYIISENFWDNAFSYILIYFCYKILLTKKMKNDTSQRWIFS
jgi:hypothetical protein